MLLQVARLRSHAYSWTGVLLAKKGLKLAKIDWFTAKSYPYLSGFIRYTYMVLHSSPYDEYS
jgi:hypothetical protein